jgi:pimeloyl-ACP methyl ester carboxylesterase
MNSALRLLFVAALCYLVLLVLLRFNESRMLYVPGGSRALVAPPAELGLRVQRVELTASDGVRLVSWALPADDGSGYWLLMCHGNAGNISEAGRPYHYAGLRALGLSLFALDYRGYGESEGVPTEQGLYRDADAAYRYLRDTLRVPAERIVVFGHSLGSAVAVELVSRVPAAGLVLDGALTSVLERAQELFPYAPVRWVAASRYSSIERVGDLTLPKLFLHARDGDVGAIYGIGFPAFRGGPLRVIDDLGASRVASILHELEDQYGERFRPAPALAEMAWQGGRYYAT